MKGFPGVKKYQDYCRKNVAEKWYILMNPVFGHRAHIYDADWLRGMQEKMKDSEFWEYYRMMKKEDPYCDTVKDVKQFFRRKSDSEKQAINYRIQNRGSCCFKLASIFFFNWILENNYQNIIKLCVPAHDEWNVECPESMAVIVSSKLEECMVKGGSYFCDKVYLGVDTSVSDHWIH